MSKRASAGRNGRRSTANCSPAPARMGEDASFFQELREAGIAIHVDHGLSWGVGHIHEHVLTNADAEAQKEAWLNRDR